MPNILRILAETQRAMFFQQNQGNNQNNNRQRVLASVKFPSFSGDVGTTTKAYRDFQRASNLRESSTASATRKLHNCFIRKLRVGQRCWLMS